MIGCTGQLDAVEVIVIESDNCSNQYKSAQHFFHLQELANIFKKDIIRIHGIAGHGKGEVDHVEGLEKVAIRQHIASGGFVQSSFEMIDFLQN